MKVLIVGAAVTGSFKAARLLRGGADVTLLARGERLASSGAGPIRSRTQ
jgi:ketopantoate reductase